MITLDLPVPPSTNRTRKIYWRGHKKHIAWQGECDALLMASKRDIRDPVKLRELQGRFEATVIMSEDHTGTDLLNTHKHLIDYLKRIGIITDDGQNYLRRAVFEWGEAPRGCRIILRGLGDKPCPA